MAYKLQYSDYSTASGPPNPAAWIGPPGPKGDPGPPGPQGIQGVAGNPFPEAPSDGALYGRGGATVVWSPVLPLIGGTLSGPLALAGNAASALQAVPLQQLTAATAGGPFLPLTGGNVSGAVQFGAVPWTIGSTDPGGTKFRITQGPSFGTNDQMVFDGLGNIGIGTANPQGKFQIINLNTAAGTFLVNQTGPTSGSFAGPIFLNNITTNWGATVTGAGLNAQVSGFHASLGLGGPNLAGVEFYGASFGVVQTSIDTCTGDKVGVAAGVASNFSSPGKVYGSTFSYNMGSGGSTPQAICCEVDAVITGTGTAVARMGFNAWQGGTNVGSSFDAAYVVSNSGAAGTDAGAWRNLFGLYTAAGTLKPALATTASFFMSDVPATVANIFNLSNLTVTGNILNFPNVTLSGAGAFTTAGLLTTTGGLTATGVVQIGTDTSAAIIRLDGPANVARAMRWFTASSLRWQLNVNGTNETGSNIGSDFDITNYDDTGTAIGNPVLRSWRATGNLQINASGSDTGFKLDVGGTTRLNGLVTATAGANISGATAVTGGALTVGSNTVAQQMLLNGAAGSSRILRWQTAGQSRWGLTANGTAEVSNAGSDLDINRFDDTGAALGNPVMRIFRSSGNVLINVTAGDAGYKLDVFGNTRLNGLVGFQGTAPIAKPTVSGACAGNTAIKALLTALVSYGLVIDSTTV